MSDIIEILAVYIADGQRIREVRPDSQTNPKGIVVVFDDGAEDFHPLSVNSREEFVKLWQYASAFSRITWATIAP
jgi:GTPase SAR1 family protein